MANLCKVCVGIPVLTASGLRKLAEGAILGPDRLDVALEPGEKLSCHFTESCLGGVSLRSEWVPPDSFALLLSALMPENRLALEVSQATGLRIGDVLALRPSDIATQRPTIKERKTGKSRRVYIPLPLWKRLHEISGQLYVFEGRTSSRKHRTRQAVYKDLRRVAALYRLDGKRIAAHLSPHSARKIYAVEVAHEGGLAAVRRDLGHDSDAVSMLYAMADVLTEQAHRPHKRRGA